MLGIWRDGTAIGIENSGRDGSQRGPQYSVSRTGMWLCGYVAMCGTIAEDLSNHDLSTTPSIIHHGTVSRAVAPRTFQHHP